VVRANISCHFDQWNTELDTFEGTSEELLRFTIRAWWERIGNTKVAGITKLMMSEAGNFPELAAFYQHEVIQPGNDLLRRVLQRGVDRGEFRPMDLQYGVYTVLAPMLFLATWKHSLGLCSGTASVIDPEQYIAVQVETLLHGLTRREAPTPAAQEHPAP